MGNIFGTPKAPNAATNVKNAAANVKVPNVPKVTDASGNPLVGGRRKNRLIKNRSRKRK